ncbi:MAG: pectate lyase [Colwellia sp.]
MKKLTCFCFIFCYIFCFSSLLLLISTPSIASDLTLPKHFSTEQQQAWRVYLERSSQYRKIEQDFINKELQTAGLSSAIKPPFAKRFGFNIEQPSQWYSTPEGKRIADIIVSFQTPSGGWSKRTSMSTHRRNIGENFGVESAYIPTFDNNATSTQLHVLAKAFQATADIRYKKAFIKGIEYIFVSQFPNGGWPQNFPLTGSYHDYITYNDDAVGNLLNLLMLVASKKPPYDLAPQALQQRAALHLKKGLANVLATQVKVNGVRTIWGAQHDTFTLQPREARAYEMVALASKESAKLLNVLMNIEKPSQALIAAIEAAITWFEKSKIEGYEWQLSIGISSSLVKKENAKPLWARFYEIKTNRALFGDRDRSIHYNVKDISHERQIKYAWYNSDPAHVLAKYPHWQQSVYANK